MDRDVLSELRDARTIINDGCNERGTLLSGERCKACVRYIDHAILLLKEQEETIDELQNAYGYLQKLFFETQDKLLKEQEEAELCDRCGRRRLKSSKEGR